MTKKASSGIALGTARKQDLETKAINDKRDQEQAKTKEISRREKERKAMQSDLEKRVSEQTNPNRNTDLRRKVVNVGRPDTAKDPMDVRAKLVKQAEIKNKIIDENQEKSMTLQKYHNLSDDLVAAVRGVLEGKNPFAKKDDEDKKKPSKEDDDADDKDTKAKKDDDSDDEDEGDDDQDKMVGKDGKKTKVDISPKMKTANEELKGGQKKLDKNHNGKLDAQDFKMLRKEELEHIEEGMTHTVWFQKGTKVGARSARGVGVTAKNDKHAIEVAKQQFPDHKNGWFVDKIKSHAKEEAEQIDEISKGKAIKAYAYAASVGDQMTDKMSDQHDRLRGHIKRKFGDKAAAHADNAAFAEYWGRGTPRPGKDKLASNLTADKMRKTQSGMIHKQDLDKKKNEIKRRMKEEVTLSDDETARILAKLNEAKGDDEDQHDGPEHIVMQLRKAKSLGAANRPIHFHDGSKVKVSSAHVQKALDMHGSFKKAPEKDEFTQKLQASHASFKKALGEQ
jgi:hypothetical protein